MKHQIATTGAAMRYAVRQHGTDNYFPHRKSARGFSHDEPEYFGGLLGPRLFNTKRAARNAITAWKRGIHEVHAVYGFEYEDHEISVTPVPSRENVVLEIVAVRLTFGEVVGTK